MDPNEQMTDFALFRDGCGGLAPDLTWTIGGIKEKLARPERFSVTNEPQFSCSSNPGVEGQPMLTMNPGSKTVSTGIHLFARQPLHPIRVGPAVCFVLKDRSGGARPRHVVRSCHKKFGNAFDGATDYWALFSYDRLASHPFNANNSVVVDVYVEPPAQAHAVQSYDGTLFWTIREWARRTEARDSGCVKYQESPYFYTSAEGFRCQARLNLRPAGREKRTVEVRIVLLSGEFDRSLRADSFPRRVDVTLQSPNFPDGKAITQIVGRNGGDERIYLVVFENVRLDELVADDRLVVRVVIQPRSSKVLEG